MEKTNMRVGTHWLGVYGRVAEPDQPGLWRVKIWQEWSDRVEITTDSIDCRPGRATRAGVTASKVVVQTLNPGGPINPANRLDHLIWWSTCFPEQAGRDPAGLGPLARSHRRQMCAICLTTISAGSKTRGCSSEMAVPRACGASPARQNKKGEKRKKELRSG
jgi:hypothetical protein